MIERGPWKIVNSRDVYADPWIRVQVDDVIRPDGQPGIHSIIHVKPGVCVLAMDAERNVYLTEEFHYAVGRVTLEGVSGGIEANETPLVTAQRELREELGISAARWTAPGRHGSPDGQRCLADGAISGGGFVVRRNRP